MLGWQSQKNNMTDKIPTDAEAARPFLPTKDFDRSKRFYEALGFTKILDGDVAIFEIGATGFILQKYYQKAWAENTMMQLLVDDLDAWWAHIVAADLSAKFEVPAPKPPALQPWGMRVAYVIDPAGVLWHIAQRRTGVKQDE
jgi:catechol 2,3-dioxygenase-like lactoylglutathione lyase family enzyme